MTFAEILAPSFPDQARVAREIVGLPWEQRIRAMWWIATQSWGWVE